HLATERAHWWVERDDDPCVRILVPPRRSPRREQNPSHQLVACVPLVRQAIEITRPQPSIEHCRSLGHAGAHIMRWPHGQHASRRGDRRVPTPPLSLDRLLGFAPAHDPRMDPRRVHDQHRPAPARLGPDPRLPLRLLLGSGPLARAGGLLDRALAPLRPLPPGWAGRLRPRGDGLRGDRVPGRRLRARGTPRERARRTARGDCAGRARAAEDPRLDTGHARRARALPALRLRRAARGRVDGAARRRRRPPLTLPGPGRCPRVPVCPGDSIEVRLTVHEVYEKTGRTGSMYFVVIRFTMTNQRSEILAVADNRFIDR